MGYFLFFITSMQWVYVFFSTSDMFTVYFDSFDV